MLVLVQLMKEPPRTVQRNLKHGDVIFKSLLMVTAFKSVSHEAQSEVLLHQLFQAGELRALLSKCSEAVCLNMDRLHEKLKWGW